MKQIGVPLGLVLIASLFLLSCGGDSSSPQSRENITVSISSVTTSLDQGATLRLTATVAGTTNTAVRWYVQEGTFGGTVDAQGLYTAPTSGGLFHVVATSVADPSRSAVVQISVNSMVITVSPSIGDVQPGEAQQFTASVTGSVNRNIVWSVLEGTAGGSIDAAGTYTAPATTGVYHVVATSTANQFQGMAHASVANLQVVIQPHGIGLQPGSMRMFTASVSGCMDDSVTWSVPEGSSGGTITGTGLYTAPTKFGEYYVTATSIAHPSISASAKIVVVSSGFTATGDMLQLRNNHTATLLTSGDVVIIGGGYSDDYGYSWTNPPQAEVYDHASGTFHAGGSLIEARDSHTATLLPNGKILVTGGGPGDWMAFQSAELYDPATGQFTSTGKMAAYRMYHTATLLGNGKILIAGGTDGWFMDRENHPEIAELYDPQTGTFTATGKMVESRLRHTATLLRDGRVLLTGGDASCGGGGCGPSLASAEVYDPATGTFTAVRSLAGERNAHSATLLGDNQVLMAGGQTYTESSWDPIHYYDDAQTYDPATGQFSSPILMNSARSYHTALLLQSGRVLFTGGYSTPSNYGMGPLADSSAELYDPVPGKFAVTGSMQAGRAGHTATLLQNGRVLVAGGASDKSAELYSEQK